MSWKWSPGLKKRERPKSVSFMGASSAGLAKRKFSGCGESAEQGVAAGVAAGAGAGARVGIWALHTHLEVAVEDA